jgi:hypothetical protein
MSYMQFANRHCIAAVLEQRNSRGTFRYHQNFKEGRVLSFRKALCVAGRLSIWPEGWLIGPYTRDLNANEGMK